MVVPAVAATVLAYGAAALARILRAADRRVVAQLWGQMLSVVVGWVKLELVEAIMHSQLVLKLGKLEVKVIATTSPSKTRLFLSISIRTLIRKSLCYRLALEKHFSYSVFTNESLNEIL